VIDNLREYLEIRHAVRTERISCVQVTNEHGRPGAALIGVVFDAHAATIYHTRLLTAEDVLHELLHVAHPNWSEAVVVRATNRGWRFFAFGPKRQFAGMQPAAFVRLGSP
jgi:hypothetical protein